MHTDRKRLRSTCLLAATALSLAGCVSQPYSHTDELKQLEQLKRDNARLTERLEETQRQITHLADQVRWGHELTDAQRAQLTLVTDIVLGRFSGGVNEDGIPGADAIKIYVRPVDADGSAIKAAGSLTVELFDLNLAEPDRLIGRWQLGPPALRREWSASFVGAFYSVTLPFSQRPANAQLTCRVEFTDLLTGRSFVKQAVFEVKLSPATQPASRRAS